MRRITPVVCTAIFVWACSSLAAPAPVDVVVTRDMFGATVPLAIGDTVSIPRPAEIEEWQVAFDSPPLDLISPRTNTSTPGPNGWRFEAVAAGETQIRLTPVLAGDAPPLPYTVAVRVAAR